VRGTAAPANDARRPTRRRDRGASIPCWEASELPAGTPDIARCGWRRRRAGSLPNTGPRRFPWGDSALAVRHFRGGAAAPSTGWGGRRGMGDHRACTGPLCSAGPPRNSGPAGREAALPHERGSRSRGPEGARLKIFGKLRHRPVHDHGGLRW